MTEIEKLQGQMLDLQKIVAGLVAYLFMSGAMEPARYDNWIGTLTKDWQ